MLEVEIVARSGQSAYGDVVMLVDEDVTCDRRVLGTLAEYSEVEVIDCASEKLTAGTLSIRAYLNGVKFLIAAAFRSAALWKLLRLKFGLRANNCVSGLLISFRTFVRAREVARPRVPNERCSTDPFPRFVLRRDWGRIGSLPRSKTDL